MNYKDKIYYDDTNDSDYVPSSSEDELLEESHSYITDEEDYAPTTLPDDMEEPDVYYFSEDANGDEGSGIGKSDSVENSSERENIVSILSWKAFMLQDKERLDWLKIHDLDKVEKKDNFTDGRNPQTIVLNSLFKNGESTRLCFQMEVAP